MEPVRISREDISIAWRRRRGVSARVLVSLAVVLVGSQAAFAVQLVRFQISLDGKPILVTSTSGHNEDPDTIWRFLKRLPLRSVKGYRIVPDRDEPMRSTLHGSIVVQVDEGGLAEVRELRLRREAEGGAWSIAEIEVNRTLIDRHKPYVFVVSVNGKPALSTGLLSRRGVASPDDHELVWATLKSSPLAPITRFKITADADDPLRTTLDGTLTIELKYNRQSWGRAQVSELKLVRKTAKARWSLDPAYAKRIAAMGKSGS
jgi:hypothetical protein